MAELTEDQKLFIVCRLACMRAPTLVAMDFEEEYGVKIERQQVRSYNPKQVKGAKRWEPIFDEVQARFREKIEDIPIANLGYRLQVLDKVARFAEGKKNHAMVMQALEQAAKDAGGAFTSRRELTGKDGGPIVVDDMAGAKDRLAERLARRPDLIQSALPDE